MNKNWKRSDQRHANILRLRELGYTYRDIGSMYGVTCGTICFYVKDKYNIRGKNYYRQNILKVTENGRKITVNTKRIYYGYVSRRLYSDTCELCGRSGHTDNIYHNWNRKLLVLGIWVCKSCDKKLTTIDTRPGSYINTDIATQYNELKYTAEQEVKLMFIRLLLFHLWRYERRLKYISTQHLNQQKDSVHG